MTGTYQGPARRTRWKPANVDQFIRASRLWQSENRRRLAAIAEMFPTPEPPQTRREILLRELRAAWRNGEELTG